LYVLAKLIPLSDNPQASRRNDEGYSRAMEVRHAR
jgi:hypothetical protein